MSNNNHQIRSIPDREATTAVQVNSLLSIAQAMAYALLAPNHNISEPHHSKPELDGGSKSAAEMTFIECCNRLTDMIRDDSRWDLLLQKALGIQAVKLNQTHIEVLEIQKKAVSGLATPSYKHKPTLIRLTDGYYCAYLGDKPEDSLCGIGRTAEEAFAAFDKVFVGQVPESMIQYLLVQEEKLKQQAANNEKTQDAEIVGQRRTGKAKKRKTKGDEPRGDI